MFRHVCFHPAPGIGHQVLALPADPHHRSPVRGGPLQTGTEEGATGPRAALAKPQEPAGSTAGHSGGAELALRMLPEGSWGQPAALEPPGTWELL